MGRSVWAVVVAGGSGTRYGGCKQFELLAGRPLVAWSVEAARGACEGVVLVLPAERLDGRSPEDRFGADAVVAGGSTRAESVRRGLDAVPGGAEVVVVHDAARPLASPSLFSAVVEPLLEPQSPVSGVVCGMPVTDTVKRLAQDGSTVEVTVARDGLVAVQTPQAFLAEVLRRAHAAGGDATDDAALVEAGGGVVQVVPGERRNVKVTTPADLVLLEHLLMAEG